MGASGELSKEFRHWTSETGEVRVGRNGVRPGIHPRFSPGLVFRDRLEFRLDHPDQLYPAVEVILDLFVDFLDRVRRGIDLDGQDGWAVEDRRVARFKEG